MMDQNDLLEKFVQNEKKSKTWTLVSVILFCLFAIGIIWLLSENKKQKHKTDIANQNTELANQRVAFVIDSFNTVIMEMRVSQSNAANISNEITTSIDSLSPPPPPPVTAIQNPEDIIEAPTSDADPTINARPTKVIAKKVTTTKAINPAPILTNTTKNNTKQIVFMQYMPNYANLYENASKLLLQHDYNVQKGESIEQFGFNSQVKYFNSSDIRAASEIVSLLKNNIDPATTLVKASGSAPDGQIEVWIGKKQVLDNAQRQQKANDIIKQYQLTKE